MPQLDVELDREDRRRKRGPEHWGSHTSSADRHTRPHSDGGDPPGSDFIVSGKLRKLPAGRDRECWVLKSEYSPGT